MNTAEVTKMERDGSDPKFISFRLVAVMSFDANSTINDLLVVWKPKVHYRAHITPELVPTLMQISPVDVPILFLDDPL